MGLVQSNTKTDRENDRRIMDTIRARIKVSHAYRNADVTYFRIEKGAIFAAQKVQNYKLSETYQRYLMKILIFVSLMDVLEQKD